MVVLLPDLAGDRGEDPDGLLARTDMSLPLPKAHRVGHLAGFASVREHTALLKSGFKALRRITPCPRRIGHITAAGEIEVDLPVGRRGVHAFELVLQAGPAGAQFGHADSPPDRGICFPHQCPTGRKS